MRILLVQEYWNRLIHSLFLSIQLKTGARKGRLNQLEDSKDGLRSQRISAAQAIPLRENDVTDR